MLDCPIIRQNWYGEIMGDETKVLEVKYIDKVDVTLMKDGKLSISKDLGLNRGIATSLSKDESGDAESIGLAVLDILRAV